MRPAGWLAVVLVGGLTLAMLVALGPDARKSAPPRAVLGNAPAANDCPDTVLVGVDGAGEGPADGRVFGRTLDPLRERFNLDVRRTGRKVRVVRIPYATRQPTVLTSGASGSAVTGDVVTAGSVQAWREGLSDTVLATEARLRQLAAGCPDQRIVLMGYAQGASVVHRVLVRTADESGIGPRIVAALLVADPDRPANTRAYLHGSPVAPPHRKGAAAQRLEAVADVPLVGAAHRVWSVCTWGDAACDLRRNKVSDALAAHRSYRPGGATFKRTNYVAGRVARRVWWWPVPSPRQTVVTVDEDARFSRQLDVLVQDAARDDVRWESVSGLPAGVTLSPTGLLSGTPTTPGTYNIDFRVRGTDPATASYPGLAVLTVQPGTRGMASGGQNTCETRGDGSLRCWGVNTYGQVGDGTTTRRVNPTPVSGGGDYAEVDTSGSMTCGVRTDGTLWCWGLNNRGQLGVGDTKPRRVPTRVGTSNGWRDVGVGWWHACATRRDGSLWCWGLNDRGQLGLMDQKNRWVPRRVGSATDWSEVVAASRHTCGLRSGQAFCWGQNAHGELGNAERKIRVQPWPVSTGYRFTDLDTAWSHTCGVARSGTPLCWGQNVVGQVGDGTRSDRWTPVVPDVGDRLFTSVGVGALHSCAVDNAGAPWCWGDNSYGQLGSGNRAASLSPGRVATSVQWFDLDGGWGHSCGATSVGVRCWGQNEHGQLGTGDTAARLTPPS